MQNPISKNSVAFIYTNNDQTEKEYKKTISFILTSKKKYLGRNLAKNMTDLYRETYKPLRKEIKEDHRRWKDLPCSWIGRINIVKIAILPKINTMINAIPIKITMTLTMEIEKSTLKFIQKHKKTMNSQGNTEI
jgi:hypothetical protein